MSINDQFNAPIGNHKAAVNPARKDGKHKVEYILTSGTRFNKLQTRDQIAAMIASEEYMVTLHGNANYIF